MWKCMMCETNNADDAESCFICYTTKADTKRYYDKLKNFSYLYDYTEYSSTKSSSSKLKETPKPLTPPLKTPEPVKTSTYSHSKIHYDDFDDEWIDSIGVSKKKEKMKIVNTCGTGEKIFMILLIIITIILISLANCTDNNLADEWGYCLISFVPIYLTARGVTIINAGNLLKCFLKMIIWFIICAFFGFASLICSTIMNSI